MSLGTCEDCGCTDEKPCEGGCSWVNDDHTLCSRCGLARANAIVKSLEQLTAPASEAGMRVGAALAELQLALFAFEEAWNAAMDETIGDYADRAELFNGAYGEATRLFGYVSERTIELLEMYREERKIVTP